MSAQMFECVNEVYKLLIPILEARRDYRELANSHDKLSKAFSDIIRTVCQIILFQIKNIF